jgi:thiosulfate reductase cytochrome b subunit
LEVVPENEGDWKKLRTFQSCVLVLRATARRDIIVRSYMANSTWPLVDATSATAVAPRHSALVRITHWIATLCILALLLSGAEIVISHPRFYWGETGNPMTPSLFDLPIPASRPWVNTGYGFVLPDQNGWSRNLHFEAAWVIIFTGFVYMISGLLRGDLRKNLLPTRANLTTTALSKEIAKHLRFGRPGPEEAWSYNVLQKITYVLVIFVLFPLAIWTGLAMSPAVLSIFPFLATVFGGLQSARTIHFFVSVLLFVFLVIHVIMVCRAGFSNRMRAMITGRVAAPNENR